MAGKYLFMLRRVSYGGATEKKHRAEDGEERIFFLKEEEAEFFLPSSFPSILVHIHWRVQIELFLFFLYKLSNQKPKFLKPKIRIEHQTNLTSPCFCNFKPPPQTPLQPPATTTATSVQHHTTTPTTVAPQNHRTHHPLPSPSSRHPPLLSPASSSFAPPHQHHTTHPRLQPPSSSRRPPSASKSPANRPLSSQKPIEKPPKTPLLVRPLVPFRCLPRRSATTSQSPPSPPHLRRRAKPPSHLPPLLSSSSCSLLSCSVFCSQKTKTKFFGFWLYPLKPTIKLGHLSLGFWKLDSELRTNEPTKILNKIVDVRY
ncbi:uncharacterized protein [Spinacia oleracea]|uniref:Uncharacterized protein n=1 Tax=Spinacia oleracea TaxID=3562 RepID=A0ABM3RPU0_SPIOL|nr:uncharacterized protein LOC130471488 [Spinacia oleracea]